MATDEEENSYIVLEMAANPEFSDLINYMSTQPTAFEVIFEN